MTEPGTVEKKPRREARRVADKTYYDTHRDEILAKAALKHRERYDKKKDTETWKEQKSQINKRYNERRRERLREEKELLMKLKEQAHERLAG